MKKILVISLFFLGLIIPNISVKAVDVSNEEELRNAIEQGGDINLTQDIVITQPLVIDKDVNIDGGYGSSIFMQDDNTLMTINNGNVKLSVVNLYAGWNGEYNNQYGYPDRNVVENQGVGLEVNGGTLNFNWTVINAGKLGLEVNGGTVTGTADIYAGEMTGYLPSHLPILSGGQGMIVNGGTVELVGESFIYSSGTAITVNNSAKVNLDLFETKRTVNSFEGNGIEINDGSVVNIRDTIIAAAKNSIYLNGGTANLSGLVGLSHSESHYAIYINEGKNSVTDDNSLSLEMDLTLTYGNFEPEYRGTIEIPSIYVNPNNRELKVNDKRKFLHYENNKLKLDYLSNIYDGPIYSNELSKCTVVYINGVKQNEVDLSCDPVTDNKNEPSQVVNVPATSAYASIIIITLGILCVVVSVIVTRRVTTKKI